MIVRTKSRFRNGVALVSGLVGLVWFAALAHAGAEPSEGRAIVDRFVENVGGDVAIESVRSIHVTGDYDYPGIEGATIDLSFARPGKLLMRIDFPGYGVIERGYNGEYGWSNDPQRGMRILEGDDLDAIRLQAQRGFSLLPSSGVYSAIEFVGNTEFKGVRCNEVHLTNGNTKTPVTEYYDEKTGLLVGRVEVRDSSQGELKVHGEVSGYQRFGDILIATEWSHSAGEQNWSATYKDVSFNDVDSSVFKTPETVLSMIED